MSTTTPADLENSLQLAIEAAAAANDAANDVATLSSETHAAADRLDKFAQVMKPLMLGLIAGAVLAIALGGLVYFRTLSEMRLATATQTEALALFSTSVGDLQEQVGSLETLGETLATLQTEQDTAFAQLEATVQTALETPAPVAETKTEGPDPLDPQMLRGLSDTVEQNHQQTRDAVIQGLSDLQLAVSRMMADHATAAPAPPPRAAPTPASSTKPREAPKPTAKQAPKARPAPNPYTFP
ncbi:MAG: hypothetical protein FKY71_14610 [Spiribacter salinus]|uniref:Uncharacterized protein n=1 Tax=Spiribacter salinus TaxID=1335746 RepID=A0A540VNE8_9GAMM|nr:MAG: hypothetical protein FKY71_14610 [Spiribacter salinus]